MATRVNIELVDDIDGSEAAETVRFGLDGTEYEIELSEANASRLREAFDGFVSAARPAGRISPARAQKGRAVRQGPDQRAVREWAQANGIEVNARGRIPQSVLDQYAAAN